jgi:hypothetical protein
MPKENSATRYAALLLKSENQVTLGADDGVWEQDRKIVIST